MPSARFALLTLAALALPAAAQAQRVSADIAIGGGPVAGRIIVGDPYYPRPSYHYYRPAYREVVVLRGHHGRGWQRHHGGRYVRVYYDAGRDCYYDREWHGGLRAVVVYDDGGRYYRDGYRGDDRRYRDDRSDDWRRDDRRYDDRRHDDRYDDDRD
jgi:hypothetical protein